MPEAKSEDSRTNVCSVCHDLYEHEVFASKMCLQCKHLFCDKHSSEVDPDYCDNCLRINKVETATLSLTDEDGVTHRGRGIKLTGEFWAAMQRDVRDMSDSELEAHVVSLQQAVREIELVRDYRRIALAHGENELEDRKSGKLRRLRLIKDVRTGKITVGAATRKARAARNPLQAVMETLRASGLTNEQIIQILGEAAKGAKK